MHTAYIELGIIERVKGLKGYLVALLTKHVHDLDKLETLFIDREHTLVPYAVEYCSVQNHRATIKLQAVDNPNTAHRLKGSAFFALQEQLSPYWTEQEQTHRLLGYQVVDLKRGKLGIVQRIDILPLQELFVVKYLKHELLIPHNEAIVKQVDHEHQCIVTSLPLGFIEALY